MLQCSTVSVSNEQVWEAHVCYLLAGEQFGFPTEAKTKMSLIGVDHRYLALERIPAMFNACLPSPQLLTTL